MIPRVGCRHVGCLVLDIWIRLASPGGDCARSSRGGGHKTVEYYFESHLRDDLTSRPAHRSMDEKQSTRDAWRRRQALTRRHGGRGRGRGQQGQPSRGGRGGRGQPSGSGHVVPEQRDRYREDGRDGFQGSRGDYAEWLSTSAKDSPELLRRQRVALPDVHDFTRFVLETRHAGSSEEDFGAIDESLDLGTIGACLARLPIEVMLATRGCEALERNLVRRIEAADSFLSVDCEKLDEGQKAGEATRGQSAAPSVPAADLAAELDAFLDLDGRGGAFEAVDAVDRTKSSTLEDDLAWFDQL